MSLDASYPATLPAPAPSARPRPNRFVTILLAVVASLLLILGGMGWWFLAGIDARYSQMLTETAASMNELHEVGLHAFTGYGAMMELRQTGDAEVREARRRTILSERAANDGIYEKLDRTLTDPEIRTLLQEVVRQRAICRQQADVMLAESFDSASTADGVARSQQFLHSCIAYQQACDKLTDRIEDASVDASTKLTREVRQMRWLFLSVGVLPIVAALLFFALTLGMLKVVKIDGEME